MYSVNSSEFVVENAPIDCCVDDNDMVVDEAVWREVHTVLHLGCLVENAEGKNFVDYILSCSLFLKTCLTIVQPGANKILNGKWHGKNRNSNEVADKILVQLLQISEEHDSQRDHKHQANEEESKVHLWILVIWSYEIIKSDDFVCRFNGRLFYFSDICVNTDFLLQMDA